MKIVKALFWILLSVVVLAACSISKYRNPQAALTPQGLLYTELPATATPQPTATIVPSATIDFQQTAIVAQQTADEARRVNAATTAQHEALLMEAIRLTAENDRREFELLMGTATAAATAIPGTQTQRVIDNILIAGQQTLDAAQLTSTKEAPTQMAAIVNVQTYKKFASINAAADVIGKFAISVFAIGVIVFLFKYPMRTGKSGAAESEISTPEADNLPVHETVVQVQTKRSNGEFSQARLVVPCTPDQLTEFAINITQGKKTMAINQWEGKDTLFTRPVILGLRAWAREPRDPAFVVPTDDNQLVPTNEFLEFLCGWLDKQILPADYQFGGGGVTVQAPTPARETPTPPNPTSLPIMPETP